MARALLIVNPRAGGGRFVRDGRPSPALEQVVSNLREAGFELEPRITTTPEEARQIAHDAESQDAEAVFALGGDGSFREVAEGLLGTRAALGLLGGGTTNVLPRALGLLRRAEDASRALVEGVELAELDVGRLRDGDGSVHHFLMMMSRGLDARALARTPPARKRRFGRLGIGWTAVSEWLRSTDPAFEIRIDDRTARASFAAAHNIELYGGSLRMAPGARWDDGRLSVVDLEREGRWAMASFAFGVLRATHVTQEAVRQQSASTVAFPGEGAAEIQIDGDPLTVRLPIEVDVLPRALRWLRPRRAETTR